MYQEAVAEKNVEIQRLTDQVRQLGEAKAACDEELDNMRAVVCCPHLRMAMGTRGN